MSEPEAPVTSSVTAKLDKKKSIILGVIGLAVTGIAGPDGGTADKPVGTVYLAMISPQGKRVERFNFSGNREQVRLRTACTALDWLRRQAMAQLSGGILEDEA